MRSETLVRETSSEQAQSLRAKLLSLLVPAGTDWLSVLLILASLVIVAATVQRADWTDTPSLPLLTLLGFLTGLFLVGLKLRGVLFHVAGLAIGAVTVLAMASTITDGGSLIESLGQLFYRLRLWTNAAGSGGISLDTVPFAFGLVATIWLLGFLAAWALLCRHNTWLALFPATGGIIANLCYLPEGYAPFLFAYLMVSLLALGRARFLRWESTLERIGANKPEWLRVHLLHAAFWFIVVALAVAFFLPRHGPVNALESSYQFLRFPIDRLGDDLSRLFAGLPARKPMPYTGYGSVFPFHGEANLSTAPALEVQSPVPMYWKARSYSEYTSTGWKMGSTQLFPASWQPSFWREESYKKQYNVDVKTTVYFSTQLLLVGGTASEHEGFQIESYDSPTYTIHPGKPVVAEDLPNDVRDLALSLSTPLHSGDVETLKAGLPIDLVLKDVEYENGYTTQLTVARVLPNPPDILAVHNSERLSRSGTYEISSSFSYATSEELRQAGENYPLWVRDRYLSLPSTLPSRVQTLARDLTTQAPTPYDKAQAIASYLLTMPYATKVEPPPYDGDGVDHFLFTLKEGYCDYYASAMTVMLRSVGVPARLAVGYLPGEETSEGVYLVRYSDSHAWSEVYFPSYGWVPFEVTPGAEAPATAVPQPKEETPPPVSGTSEGGPYKEIDEDIPSVSSNRPPPSQGSNLIKTLPWLALPLALGIILFALWQRIMTPPVGAQAVYRRTVLLSTLAGMGPRQSQTPYEYARGLGERLPEHKGPFQAIAESYVKYRYGRKDLSTREQDGLRRAWLDLRRTLLLRLLKRW